MIDAPLTAWLASAIAGDRTLTLAAALAPSAAAIAGYLGATSVIVSDATLAGDGTPIVTGQATLFGQVRPISLAASGDVSAPTLTLTIELATGSTLGALFGPAPRWLAYDAEAGLVTPTTSFLDAIEVADGRLVATSAAGGQLVAGLNLLGTFTPTAGFAGSVLTGVLAGWASGGAVTGTIVPSTPPQYELRVATTGQPFTVGSLTLGEPFLALATDPGDDQQSPSSRVAVGLPIAIGSPPIALVATGALVAGTDELVLQLDGSRSATLANGLADLAAMLGVAQAAIAPPSGLSLLGALTLDQVAVGIDLTKGEPTLIAAQVSLGADAAWSLPIPGLTVSDVATWWSWAPAMTPSVQGGVSATITLATKPPIVIELAGEYPGFTLAGSLETAIDLSTLVGDWVDISALPTLTLAALRARVTPSPLALTLSCALDGSWGKALGAKADFAIGQLCAELSYVASTWSMAVVGTAQLGPIAVTARWNSGGDFAIVGQLAAIRLQQVLAAVTDGDLTLPKALDLALTSASLAITEHAKQWTLALTASVDGFGTAFFELVPGESGWGFAAGVEVTVGGRLDRLPGFSAFADLGVTVEGVVVVVTSAGLAAGATIPATPLPGATSLTIPVGFGATGPGVTLLGTFAFGDASATTNARLKHAYQKLGIDPIQLALYCAITEPGGTLQATVMIGASLSASTDGAGPVGAGLGQLSFGLYFGATVGLTTEVFARGLLTVPIDRSPVTFTVELDLQAEGLDLSGSMVGAWSAPFGNDQLTISDVGIVLGCDWEGVPTVGFAGELSFGELDASCAVLFNSDEPSESVLAGAIAQLTVGMVARVLVPEVAELPADFLQILDGIGVVGTAGPSVAADPALLATLDGGGLPAIQAVAGAFPSLGLTASVTATLFVIGSPGQRYYVTDRGTPGASSTPIHYALAVAAGELTVSVEAQLYIVPTTVTIAGLSYPAGYSARGALDLFGWSIAAALTLPTTGGVPTGLQLAVRMESLSLFDGALTLTKADDDSGPEPGDGPYLTLAASLADPVGTPPTFAASGRVVLLGMTMASIAIDVTATGWHIALAATLPDDSTDGAKVSGTCDFTASPLALTASASAGLTLDLSLDLSSYGLGTYAAAGVTFTAAISAASVDGKLTGSASGQVSISIPVLSTTVGPYSIGPVTVDATDTLATLAGRIKRAITELTSASGVARVASDVAAAIKQDADAFVTLVADGVIALASGQTVDDVLSSVFGVTHGDVAATSCLAATAIPRMAHAAAAARGAPATAAAQAVRQLAALRQVRADVAASKSPMAEWLLDVYTTISQPLATLFQQDPTLDVPGLGVRSFQQLFTDYQGQRAFAALTAAVEDPTLVLTAEVLESFEYIIVGALAFAPADSAVSDALTSLIAPASQLRRLSGLDYQQILAQVATMTPPGGTP